MTKDEALKLLEDATRSGNNINEQRALDALMREALAQPPQPPQPPQRTWVGLTEEEIEQAIELISMLHGDYATEVAYAIEAKLKELNDHSI